MSTQNQSEKKARPNTMGISMALGLVLGGLFGIVAGQMIIFAGFGMVLGLSIGLALEKKRISS